MRGDIRTKAEVHAANCMTPGWSPDGDSWSPGEVRRCPHGKLQEAIDVPGWGPCCWRDLSPIWTPVRWRRAQHAARTGGPRHRDDASSPTPGLIALAMDQVWDQLDPEGYGWAAGDGPTPDEVVTALVALGWRPPSTTRGEAGSDA